MKPTEITWNFVGLKDPSWIDPPRFDEMQAAPYFGPIRSELKERLDGYHSIPKNCREGLDERSEKLAELAGWLACCQFDKRLLGWMNCVKELAASKTQHLQALSQIYCENWHEDQRLHDYHHALEGWQDRRFRPIVLTKRRYFWPEYGTHWGDYWMETLDPAHRHLPHMHAWWERLLASGQKLPHYLLWLEENHAVAHKSWMRYFSPEEQQETRILFNQGHLTNLRGRPLNCTDSQHFFFVIDLNKTLFACRAQPHICHSSFTRGGPVLASGGLQARDGKLTHIKFESGHYIAGPAEWWQALQIFLESGITWGDGVRITVYDRFRYISRVLSVDSTVTKDALLLGLGLRPDDEWLLDGSHS